MIKPVKPNVFVNDPQGTADANEVNENFDILYSKFSELIDLVNALAGTKPDLTKRLTVSMNDDGTLKVGVTAGGEWINPALTPAFLSASSFTVVGDHTDIYTPTRRVKVVLSTSTVYSQVLSATFSVITNFTTINIVDAVLTDPLTSVEHAIISSSAYGGTIEDIPGNANTATLADTVDGFHASQTPAANQVPVITAGGILGLSSAGSAAQLRTNGDVMAARSTTDGVVFLNTSGTRFIECLNGVYLVGNGASTYPIRHDANTFHGRVNSAGTASRLPAGWTSSKISTGIYQVTHGLGHENYTVIPTGLNLGVTVTAAPFGTTAFRVYGYTAVYPDTSFSFVVLVD
jgi:hypothetical protein